MFFLLARYRSRVAFLQGFIQVQFRYVFVYVSVSFSLLVEDDNIRMMIKYMELMKLIGTNRSNKKNISDII